MVESPKGHCLRRVDAIADQMAVVEVARRQQQDVAQSAPVDARLKGVKIVVIFHF